MLISWSGLILYVDDLLICYRLKYIHAIERKLQQCLDKINKWATENGFRFSKTKCVHFCHQRKLVKTEIPIIDEYKFLGLIFDLKKLTFISHLKYLKAKCSRTLQLLCVIAITEWGAVWKTLLKLYRSLTRLKLDYGNFIYQSARKTYLKILNPIYHADLRLVLGGFKAFLFESNAEGNKAPANIRSNKLAFQHYAKLNSRSSNPAYDGAFHPKYRELFKRSERAIKLFGLQMETIKEKARINLTKIHNMIIPKSHLGP